MSEEEKKAIEWFKKDLMFWLIEGKDYVIIDNGEIPKMKSLLNLIDNQQKEIEEKTTILLAGAEKVKQLEKEIEALEIIHNTYKEMIEENNYISKDKIREIFQFYIERDSLFNDDTHKMTVIRLKDVLQELLEED